jgi:hypothetical protein
VQPVAGEMHKSTKRKLTGIDDASQELAHLARRLGFHRNKGGKNDVVDLRINVLLSKAFTYDSIVVADQ